MRRIDRLLGESIEQREIVRAAEAWQALNRWPEVVGASLAERSWPDRFEQGTVYVAVTGSAWAQELRMQKPTILLRLGKLLGNRALVQDVRFGVRELPARAREPRPAPKAKPAEHELSDIHEITAKLLRRASNEESESSSPKD